MNQHWNSTELNCRSGYFQGNHSFLCDEYNQTCNKKAYLNPQIVNYEFIKRSLLKNSVQGGGKIHVNPNFKGNAFGNVNNNQQLINTALLNSQNTLLCNPGTSSAKNVEDRSSVDMYLYESLNNTVRTSHQSRFKKINKINQKNSNKYSWYKNKSDKLDSCVKNTVHYTTKPVDKICTFNQNQSKYKYTLPKKINSSTCQNQKNRKIYKSATKIINESKTNSVSCKTKLCLKEKKNQLPLKKHLFLSKYVYNKNKNSSTLNVAKAVRSKYKFLSNLEFYKKSKYKIDKRDKLPVIAKKNSNSQVKDIRKLFPNHLYNKFKLSPYNIYSLQNHQILSKRNFLWRKSLPSSNVTKKTVSQFPNRRVVKIGGILYKSTANKLTLANKKVDSSKKKGIISKSKVKKIHVVYVRGEKFILENNGKALRRQCENSMSEKAVLLTPKRIDIGGVTYIQKSKNILIRTNVHEARHLVNRAKNKSIALLTSLYKRSSMPCMIYHKFGRCIRHTKGLCMYKHDPKNIAVCKKFLQGNCKNNNCLLSHQITQEKMATCHFFLKGLCFRDNCPFLHVKLNKNAEICENFLQGFCTLGKQCTKRHLNMCPKFDKFSSCNFGTKCHYPHIKFQETVKQKKLEAINKGLNQSNKQNETKDSNTQEKQRKSKKSVTKTRKKKSNIKKSLSLNNAEDNTDVVVCFPKRIKLDKLPCYIPLNSEK